MTAAVAPVLILPGQHVYKLPPEWGTPKELVLLRRFSWGELPTAPTPRKCRCRFGDKLDYLRGSPAQGIPYVFWLQGVIPSFELFPIPIAEYLAWPA